MTTPLKTFQTDAIEHVAEAFVETARMLTAATDLAGRRAVIRYAGCVLVEAPTGAGKTLIAGHIAERVSESVQTVWFWYAPFRGLTDQSEAVIQSEFPGLRTRSVRDDRDIVAARSGDVYVMTWQTVAARNAESRQVRQDGEVAASIDNYVATLRASGFRIGAVIDEAHHGFARGGEAVRFYREILDPDFAILVTATPNDADIDRFKAAAGITQVRKISVSRRDCIDADLIKQGVRAVAFLADGNAQTARIADLERTAISHGVALHRQIRASLDAVGVNMEPLLLVQVESRDGSVEEARKTILSLGFSEDEVAVHTADEPDPDVLAIARDEQRKVLIFKMAVALGFDAPRAFVLVALRRVRDPDFGVQLVGRILRVDRRLQGREKPPQVNFGYVVLADYGSQSGLTNAADRINRIVTDLAGSSPHPRVAVVSEASGLTSIQYTDSRGQGLLFGVPGESAEVVTGAGSDTAENPPATALQADVFALWNDEAIDPAQLYNAPALTAQGHRPVIVGTTAHRYSLRTDLAYPANFMREEYPVAAIDQIVDCIASRIRLDGEILTAAHRRVVNVTRRDTEIFTGETEVSTVRADLNMREVHRFSQQVLFSDDYIDGRDLHMRLIDRLREEAEALGWPEADNEEALDMALALILTQYPTLIDEAKRHCMARYKTQAAGTVLPEELISDEALVPSRLNLYRVMPPDLNEDERQFADMLDNDQSGTVEWWLRNEARKPWSVKVLVPGLREAYYPDFVVKVHGRTRGEGLLLLETKGRHILNSPDTVFKARAAHLTYQRVMMVCKDERDVWHTVINDEAGLRNILDQRFRVALLAPF